MKRSPELQPLSRDHHQALYAALRLRRAGKEDKSEAARAFVDFWHEHGQVHFRAEDDGSAPGLLAWRGDTRGEAVARVLSDHVEIRARARRTASNPTPEELHELGEQLAEHVRFEEDELITLVERTLDSDQLTALGRELDRAERSG